MTKKLVQLEIGELERLDKCPCGLVQADDNLILFKFQHRLVGYNWHVVSGEVKDRIYDGTLVRPLRMLLDVPAVPVAGEVV